MPKDEENGKAETTCECSTILKELGLRSTDEAAKILHNLLEQNILSPQQLKLKPNRSNQRQRSKPDSKTSTQYMTRHIALRFHYDGSTYNGLAQNVNSPQDNSVEKVLFSALQKTCLIESRSSCGYSRSGRTDKGVSAFGQVVALRVRSAFPVGTSFFSNGDGDAQNGRNSSHLVSMEGSTLMQEADLPKNHLEKIKCWVPVKPKGKTEKGGEESKLVSKEMTERDFAQIINNVLPSTVRVLGWSPVTDEFSARFSTKSRIFRYFFVRRDLDLDAMLKGLELMTGRHDFRNLCKMNCEEVDNFERVIHDAKIVMAVEDDDGQEYVDYSAEQCGDNGPIPHSNAPRQICYFEIKGQAFLWHQIRCIASLLFMVGKRLESPQIIRELLDIEKNPGKPCYPFAPDLPLVLHRCEYGNLRFGHSVQNLWRASCDLESKWEDLVLAAERLKNGLVSMNCEGEVHKDDVSGFVSSILAEKRKKQDRRKDVFQSSVDKVLPEPVCGDDGIMKWNDALAFIYEHTGLRPNAEGPTVKLHIPLMQRGRGTTYEEKIKAILSTDSKNGSLPSKRRRAAYEGNIKKKKVSKDEDEAFYQHMSAQGGSGF